MFLHATSYDCQNNKTLSMTTTRVIHNRNNSSNTKSGSKQSNHQNTRKSVAKFTIMLSFTNKHITNHFFKNFRYIFLLF